MKTFGKYIIEDVETSYYPGFGGGPIGTKGTFIDHIKSLIDVLNRDYTEGWYKKMNRPRRDVVKYSIMKNDNKIWSLNLYPNCVVINFGYDELYLCK